MLRSRKCSQGCTFPVKPCCVISVRRTSLTHEAHYHSPLRTHCFVPLIGGPQLQLISKEADILDATPSSLVWSTLPSANEGSQIGISASERQEVPSFDLSYLKYCHILSQSPGVLTTIPLRKEKKRKSTARYFFKPHFFSHSCARVQLFINEIHRTDLMKMHSWEMVRLAIRGLA